LSAVVLIAPEMVSSVARVCVLRQRTGSQPPWATTLRVGPSTPPGPSRRVCRTLLEGRRENATILCATSKKAASWAWTA